MIVTVDLVPYFIGTDTIPDVCLVAYPPDEVPSIERHNVGSETLRHHNVSVK